MRKLIVSNIMSLDGYVGVRIAGGIAPQTQTTPT